VRWPREDVRALRIAAADAGQTIDKLGWRPIGYESKLVNVSFRQSQFPSSSARLSSIPKNARFGRLRWEQIPPGVLSAILVNVSARFRDAQSNLVSRPIAVGNAICSRTTE
jgi:hypothetical protein